VMIAVCLPDIPRFSFKHKTEHTTASPSRFIASVPAKTTPE
jgi:hypothetical protein